MLCHCVCLCVCFFKSIVHSWFFDWTLLLNIDMPIALNVIHIFLHRHVIGSVIEAFLKSNPTSMINCWRVCTLRKSSCLGISLIWNMACTWAVGCIHPLGHGEVSLWNGWVNCRGERLQHYNECPFVSRGRSQAVQRTLKGHLLYHSILSQARFPPPISTMKKLCDYSGILRTIFFSLPPSFYLSLPLSLCLSHSSAYRRHLHVAAAKSRFHHCLECQGSVFVSLL